MEAPNTIRNIQAVIFDMDGLMLDTERMGLEIFKQTVSEFAFEVTTELYLQTVGRNWLDTQKILCDALGEEFPFEQVRRRYRERMRQEIDRTGISCKPGLHRALNRIRSLRLPSAVATSTSRESALALLKTAEIVDYFSVIVAGDEIRNGKPHPEIFLMAAERLGIAPQHCLVFEDSAAGIQAAHAAGMIPVWIPDLAAPDAATAQLACHVLRSLDEAHFLFDGCESEH